LDNKKNYQRGTKVKPSAAYNTMNEFERQCYDWGWQDSQERIIKLLHDNIGWCQALEYEVFAEELETLIKGEQK
jgi:hypothetical protein